MLLAVFGTALHEAEHLEVSMTIIMSLPVLFI